MDINELAKEYDNWEKEKHNITNKEYYALKNKLENIIKYSKFLLYVQAILLGLVLAVLVKI